MILDEQTVDTAETSPDAMGRRLAEVRTENDLSQAAMAKRFGLSTKGYQNYERGIREPPAKLLVEMYKTFAVEPLWVLTGSRMSEAQLSMVEDVGCQLETALEERGLRLSADRYGKVLRFLVEYFAAVGRVDRSALDALLPDTERG